MMVLVLACTGLGITGGELVAAETTDYKATFFDEVEPIRMEDPLGVVLGTLNQGDTFVYSYGDAVKLAGHSCPAVSGGYKMTQLALKELYPGETPVRGEIEVRFRGGREVKANGPISQLVGMLTGAAPETGFAGMGGGKYSRKNLMTFDEEDVAPSNCVCSVVFSRVDSDKKVDISYFNDMLETKPAMDALMPKAIGGTATAAELAEFGELWQERVRTILMAPPDSMFVIGAP